MADLFREIDEELRQERAARLWQRYGKYAIAAAVLIVLGVAAYKGWEEYRRSLLVADSARYMTAHNLAREGKEKEARDIFAVLEKEGTDGYAVLARLSDAGATARTGDVDGAVAQYDAIANDGAIAQQIRHLALIRAVQLRVDDPKAEPKALIDRLAPLADARNPWRGTALETMGTLALRAGDTAKAREYFTRIADDLELQEGLRTRAAELLATLGG
ncbi:MAG: tetratricopeptide repeat protein [Rhodospirillales bacterium]